MVKEIENIDEYISYLRTGKPIIVDFYGSTCPPCQAIAPVFEQLAKKYTNMFFLKINVDRDETAELVEICEVSSIPTFCTFKNSEFVNKLVGKNEYSLEQLIRSSL